MNLLSPASYSSLRSSLLFRCNRRPNRCVHLAVAGAAAQIAAQCSTHLGFRRIGILSHQRLHGHDESRSAEAALRAAPVAVSFLNRRQAAMLAHALDGRDLLLLAT